MQVQVRVREVVLVLLLVPVLVLGKGGHGLEMRTRWAGPLLANAAATTCMDAIALTGGRLAQGMAR